jgi:hypothetical protein
MEKINADINYCKSYFSQRCERSEIPAGLCDTIPSTFGRVRKNAKRGY